MRFVALAAAAFFATAPILAGTPVRADDTGDDASLDDIPHITIVGTAHVDVAPDLAIITLGVTTERASAAAAAGETARKTQAVIDAAKAAGVLPNDIATQSVTVSQTFDDIHDKDGRYVGQRPRGFAAANTIAVKLHDLAKAGDIAETLIEKGANRFDGIEFAVAHPEPLLDRLTGEAVANARRQAGIAANAAGVKLGRVLSIERAEAEGGAAVARPSTRMKTAAAPAPQMPVEPGTSNYSTSMVVTWALAPN